MKLKEPEFRNFPLGSITPGGWLAGQLALQLDGLSGHLDEFWPDIRDSAWIGGSAEGWERMPYWLDGVIPLAWITRCDTLKTRISGYLDYIIGNQHSDGWLGPRIEHKKEAADLWSQALALKMLMVYHDATGDERVPVAASKALRMLDRHIDAHPLSNWGQYRWFEFLVSIWWLYERTGEDWLLELAVKLHAQGFAWKEFFRFWPLTTPTEKGRWNYAGHVVNNAMAIKEGGLWWRFTGDESDRSSARIMMDRLDFHHGMPTGVFTGDECLAGDSAIQGTELCAVAEYMYSLECLFGILGDAPLADRLELLGYNALPATFSPDMWSHQYDQQLNQVECSINGKRNWTTNNPDANIFGLEPNYGCCTANLSQGWPKLAASLWMRPRGGGIAAVLYAPSRLDTRMDGMPVSVESATGYPFRQDIRLTVKVPGSCRFPLMLRIPEWCVAPELVVEGESVDVANVQGFHSIDRTWSGETTVELRLPAPVNIIRRPNRAVSIRKGPLLYALKIGEDWRRINHDKPFRELPHGDWEVHPTTPWNYAVELDETADDAGISFTEHPLGMPVFSPDCPPVSGSARGWRVSGWTVENGSAGPTPASPVPVKGPGEDILLVPYGCTNLRIAEFPLAGQADS